MELNRTKVELDREARNNENQNWEKIEKITENITDEITEKTLEKLVDEARLTWKEPVDTYNDLAITYPNPEIGWTVQIRGTGHVYRYDGKEWKEIQEIDISPVNALETRLEDELENKLSVDGGELSGSLYLKSPKTADFNDWINNPTSRITLESYLKSNKPNDHAGDVLQLIWRNQGAKPFIGWWDGAANPEKPELKAWIGAHTLANNPESEPHNHWSIEVTDSTGQLHTRLAIPFDKDHTNIKTSDADFTVGYGTLRVAGETGMNRDLEFADKADADPSQARFSFRLDSNNNFRIIARDDNGNPIASGSPFFIERLTGRVGFGTTTPTHQVHMRSPNQALRIEGTSSSTLTPLFAVDHKTPTNRIFGIKVDGDSDYRFMIEASGHLSWGEGNGRDTFLYRKASARLETNSDLIFTGQKGPILRDINGVYWRIKVNSDGTLATIRLAELGGGTI